MDEGNKITLALILIQQQISRSMTEVSRFINLLIEFGQKLESHVNKKYKSFIRSTLNLQELAKSISSDKIKLTQEVIAFKLGVQSKSTKCIEMTLTYLLKLFTMGYIDINVPNYCEDYTILESSVERKAVNPDRVYEKQLREQICQWLSPLVHFKNNEINNLLLKIYEFMVSEPILPSLLDLSAQVTNEHCFSVFFSFFSYRFYLFEEVYEYTQEELQMFSHLSVHNHERLLMQIKNAMDRQEALENLIEKYVGEIVSRVAEEGGKYGCCVVCGQGAEYYCKSTKAALCGLDCKKKHLEIAEKQYKEHYQANVFKLSIIENLNLLCSWMAEKDSPFLLSVFLNLIETPYLFMLIRSDFKSLLKRHLPKIMDRAYQSKHDQTFETLYFMMPPLAKWWAPESLSEIEYFFRENVIRILKDKKPNFRMLMLTFKALDKIFRSGKTIVQLYINLDCEMNRTNVIGLTLFELSKMAQDRFQNTNFYMKQEKISIKNSCVTLFTAICKGLNEYNKTFSKATLTSSKEHFLMQKERKNKLEIFIEKFNQHWSQGLKSLFNLDLVGLESDQEIVNIIMSQGGLSKIKIDAMLFDKSCQQYLEIFMSRLTEDMEESLLSKVLDLFQFIPLLDASSPGVKKFVEAIGLFYGEKKSVKEVEQEVHQILSFVAKCKSYKDFVAEVPKFHVNERQYDYLYLKMLKSRKPETSGVKIPNYVICLSHSYLETLSLQLSLLQIPLSYLLETEYQSERLLILARELIPISVHSNWVSLLIKYSGMDNCGERQLNITNIKLIRGILEVVTGTADYINEDWLPILTFFCNIHYILTEAFPPSKKSLLDNQTLLKAELSTTLIENSLINSSMECKQRFPKFIQTTLSCAIEELKTSSAASMHQEQVFMLQKLFYILEVNLSKYLKNFDEIFQYFLNFVQSIEEGLSSPEIYIYICDNVKQMLLKIFKAKKNQVWPEENKVTCSHLQVFSHILSKNQAKEVKEFIMNCITTIVVHQYALHPRAWDQILSIIMSEAENFPYQSGVMVRKILSEKMMGLGGCEEKLLSICVKLVKSKNNEDNKACVEAIHNVRTIIEGTVENRNKSISEEKDEPKKGMEERKQILQEIKEEEFINKLNLLLRAGLSELINLLQFNDHSESVAETLFLMFSFGVKFNPPLLTLNEDVFGYINQIFSFLEEQSLVSEANLQISERIMNETLYWSVKSQNKKIIKNLEVAVLNKYSRLSITALKCIKTYIQMADPKEEEEWVHIEESLMNIIENSLIQRDRKSQNHNTLALDKIIKNQYEEELREKKAEKKAEMKFQYSEVIKLAHRCLIQAFAVKLLPNDSKCLPLLMSSYEEKIQFNDDILRRVMLWKSGLCPNQDSLPELLELEETISNRIMAIHIRYNDFSAIIHFFIQICHRYIEASQLLETFLDSEKTVNAQCNPAHAKLYDEAVEYLNKRRMPLLKLVGYVLPKLPRFCSKAVTRKSLLLELSQVLPFVESRDGFIRAIRELSQAKYSE